MELKEAITILENHNEWRRNDEVPNSIVMVEPKELGIAIETIVSEFKKLPIHNVSQRSFPEKKLHLSQANGSRILEIRGRTVKNKEVIINCTEHWESDDPNFGSPEHHDAAFFVKADDINKIIETLEQAKVFLNGG